jgi:hypothetical protein
VESRPPEIPTTAVFAFACDSAFKPQRLHGEDLLAAVLPLAFLLRFEGKRGYRARKGSLLYIEFKRHADKIRKFPGVKVVRCLRSYIRRAASSSENIIPVSKRLDSASTAPFSATRLCPEKMRSVVDSSGPAAAYT